MFKAEARMEAYRLQQNENWSTDPGIRKQSKITSFSHDPSLEIISELDRKATQYVIYSEKPRCNICASLGIYTKQKHMQ